jgi:hypothetical protein
MISRSREIKDNNKKIFESNEDTCAVCFELLPVDPPNEKHESNTMKLPCGHVFCRGCITKWLKENNSCAVCRAKVKVKNRPKKMNPSVTRALYSYNDYNIDHNYGDDWEFIPRVGWYYKEEFVGRQRPDPYIRSVIEARFRRQQAIEEREARDRKRFLIAVTALFFLTIFFSVCSVFSPVNCIRSIAKGLEYMVNSYICKYSKISLDNLCIEFKSYQNDLKTRTVCNDMGQLLN